MADETEGSIIDEAKEKAKAALREITEVAVSSVLEKIPGIGTMLGTSINTGTKDSTELFSKEFAKASEDIGIAFQDSIEQHGKVAAEMFKNTLGSAATGLINVSQLFKGDISEFEKTLQSVMSGVGDFFGNNSIDLASYLGLNKAAEIVSGANNPFFKAIIEQEKLFQGLSGNVTGSLAGMRGAFSEMSPDANTLSESVGGAINRIGETMSNLGLPLSEVKSGMDSLVKSGLEFGQIGQIELRTGDAEASLSGLSAAFAIAKATGQDVNSVIAQMTVQMKTLGVEGSEVGDVFATIRATQEGTRLSFVDVQNALTAGATGLKFYGTNVEGLTGLFKTLNEALGEGRENLTGELFQQTLSGLTNLDFSKKAFLASTTSLGEGRDTIGAGLEYEQAISEGRIDELLSAFKETLQKYGGSGEILTREDALESGQGEEFILQRQLAAQFLNINEAAYNDFAKAVKSDGRTAAEFIGQQGAQEELAQTGQDVITAETGIFGSSANKLRGEALESMSNFTASFIDNSRIISESVSDFASQIRNSFTEGVQSTKKDKDEYVPLDASTGEPIDIVKQFESAANVQDRQLINNERRETDQALGKKGLIAAEEQLPTLSGIPEDEGNDYVLGSGLKLNYEKPSYEADTAIALKSLDTPQTLDANSAVTATNSSKNSSVTTADGIPESLAQALEIVANLKLNVSVEVNNDGTLRFVTEDQMLELKRNIKSDYESNRRSSVE